MVHSSTRRALGKWGIVVTICYLLVGLPASTVQAVQNPQSDSLGLEATIPGAAPTQAATIVTPSSGQTFTTTPITVSGLCKSGLLVKLFSNNIFIGSIICSNGSYSLKADLFSGRNDLVARVYDALDQAGPDSSLVSVTFNDAQFAQFGTHVALSSNYARLGANPGSPLNLPIILSGGHAPYALSIDWGDGNGSDLKTISFAGTIDLSHSYTQAGVYNIVIKATDDNGTAAYLQVVGVANGKINGVLQTDSANGGTTTRTVILWQPFLLVIPLLLLTFWLGRRHERIAFRRSLDASRQDV